MRRRWLFPIALLAASTACVPDETIAPAGREVSLARSGGLTLSNTARPVLWSGVSLRDAPAGGDIPECAAVPCLRYDLTVSLPGGAWRRRSGGGVQVALRWEGFGNNLRLYVYRGGARVAVSDGIIATAQSVLIPEAPNGAYRLYVAYDAITPAEFGIDPAERIPFDMLAEVEYAPRAQPRRALLPDLVARPQRQVSFETPPPIFFEAGVPTTSCFPSEISEEGARLCLRFDQVLANVGEGALDFRFLLPADPEANPTGDIIQRIARSDGGFTERVGGAWEFHPTHQHYHYSGFALSRLWKVDAEGRRASHPAKARRHRVGMSAGPVRSGRKVSFCIVDIEIDAWAEKGDAPRTYNAPACLEPTPEGHLRQGLSAGWADVYDWFLPDQYIEATGLANGTYLLETVVDPDDTILEADESNNCGGVFVRLSGMTTATPRATLLGPARACGGERR